MDLLRRARPLRQDAVRRRRPTRIAARVRVYTETAWASIFARNLFRRPTAERSWRTSCRTSRSSMRPSFQADPETRRHAHRDRHPGPPRAAGDPHRRHRVRRRDQEGRLRGHELPTAGRGRPADALVASTSGPDGDAAIFFGLSGTGKTTLSADPERILIGDDEHGWSDDGVFNFEGGCYAKTIRLSPDLRAGHLLHDAALRDDPRERRPSTRATRELDLDSERLTENTRGAFPLDFISNSSTRPAWPAIRARSSS